MGGPDLSCQALKLRPHQDGLGQDFNGHAPWLGVFNIRFGLRLLCQTHLIHH